MEAFETFEVDGLTVELHQDVDPSSPADWDTLGTLVAFPELSRQYALGRESDGHEDEAFERGGGALLARYLEVVHGQVIVPFRFADYGSSGARLWPTVLEDERLSGFIATTPGRVAELCGAPDDGETFYKPGDFDGAPREWVEEQLRGELREWAHYVEGAVVGIVVKDEKGEVLESVWGCYPDDEGDGLGWIREEGRMLAEGEAEAIRAKARQVGQAWASLYLSRGFGAVA